MLALKDDHPTLHDRVRKTCADADRAAGTALPLGALVANTTTDKGHGRIEHRRCWAMSGPASLADIDPHHAWPNLRSVVCVESTRRIGDTVSTEARHSLASLPADAARLARTIRRHWGIENRLHRALDGVFREDNCRVRADHAPQNLAIIRHFALNLLRQEHSQRTGLATTRLRAALDDTYLRSILTPLSA